jgi:hypothetical protein
MKAAALTSPNRSKRSRRKRSQSDELAASVGGIPREDIAHRAELESAVAELNDALAKS